MLLAASGTPLNMHDQVKSLRLQFSDGPQGVQDVRPAVPTTSPVFPNQCLRNSNIATSRCGLLGMELYGASAQTITPL